MSGWRHHDGMAAGLDQESIDTDQLIPARFMSAPRSEGYGRFLLHDMRFDEGGAPRQTPLRPDTSILVARRNFGSGSSREAAVYALVDYGIRAVIAPSFGDIFASNAVNNGLLPARVDADTVERMLERLDSGPAPARVDLEAGIVDLDGERADFDLSEAWRFKLVNGFDDIDVTRQHMDRIEAFRRTYRTRSPWIWPGAE